MPENKKPLGVWRLVEVSAEDIDFTLDLLRLSRGAQADAMLHALTLIKQGAHVLHVKRGGAT